MSQRPRPYVSTAVTDVGEHPPRTEWLQGLRLHAEYVGSAENGEPPCLETEVQCGATTVTVETCCQVGESPEDCVRRHAAAVETACD